MCRFSKMLKCSLLTLAMTGVICALALGAESPIRPELERKFREAVKLHRTGQYDQAAEALNDVLQMNPSDEEAWLLSEQVGVDQMIRMLHREATATQILQLIRQAKERETHLRRDPEQLQKLIGDLDSPEAMVRWQAIRELEASGPYAVPYLLEPLTMPEAPALESRKLGATIAFRNIGTDAVPALIPLLWSGDNETIGVVVGLFPEVLDIRAAPPLLAIRDSAEHSAPLRQAAGKALAGVFQREMGMEMPGDDEEEETDEEAVAVRMPDDAGTACADLAERYYYKDPRLVELIPPKDRVVWYWDESGQNLSDRIRFKDVPMWAYPRVLSRHYVLAGIRRNAENKRLQEIYVSNSYALLNDAIAMNDQRAETLNEALAINKTVGTEVIYASLDRAVADQNIPLALRAVEALRELDDPRPYPHQPALIQAMGLPDLTARVKAAETLMRLSPDGSMGGANVAVDVVNVGLGAQARPRVAVVTQDDELYSALAEPLMIELSAVPRRHEGLQSALNEAKMGQLSIQVMMIEAEGQDPEDLRAIARGIHADALTAEMPVVFLVPEDDVQAVSEAVGDEAAAVLTMKPDVEILATTVNRALRARESSFAGRGVLENQALLARVLATLAEVPQQSAYPIGLLAPGVAKMVKGHPDEIRLLALEALANLRVGEQRDAAYNVFQDEADSLAVRQRAGHTFLTLLPLNPLLTHAQRDRLRAMTESDDEIIAAQAVHALGLGAIPAAERQQFLLRIDQAIRQVP